jgi:hypothetical protein
VNARPSASDTGRRVTEGGERHPGSRTQTGVLSGVEPDTGGGATTCGPTVPNHTEARAATSRRPATSATAAPAGRWCSVKPNDSSQTWYSHCSGVACCPCAQSRPFRAPPSDRVTERHSKNRTATAPETGRTTVEAARARPPAPALTTVAPASSARFRGDADLRGLWPRLFRCWSASVLVSRRDLALPGEYSLGGASSRAGRTRRVPTNPGAGRGGARGRPLESALPSDDDAHRGGPPAKRLPAAEAAARRRPLRSAWARRARRRNGESLTMR